MSKMHMMAAVSALALLGVPAGAMADALIPGSGATFYVLPKAAAQDRAVATQPAATVRSRSGRTYQMPRVTTRGVARDTTAPASKEDTATTIVIVPGSEADF